MNCLIPGMRKRNRFLSVSFLLILAVSSCTKIERTSLGGDLLPGSDRLITDTMLLPVTANSFIENDTSVIGKGELHAIGYLNDPVFGTTTAVTYMQFLPSIYPLYPKVKDSLVLDSIVLSVGFSGTYGDTNAISKVSVYRITDNTFKPRNRYRISQAPSFNPANLLGTKTFSPKDLRKPYNFQRHKDTFTVTNQLRIKLDSLFGRSVLDQNIVSVFGGTGDSVFRQFLNGIAIVPDSITGGNAMNYFNLTDTATKISLYYRVKRPTAGQFDTTVSTLVFSNQPNSADPLSEKLSANANKIHRNFASGTAYPFLTSGLPANLIYIGASPGTAARVKVPGLDTIKNKPYIIHRAELVARQVYQGPLSIENILTPPFLHLFTYTADGKTASIPYDSAFYWVNLNLFDANRNVNYYLIRSDNPDDPFRYTGGEPNFFRDQANNLVAEYRMNITSFVQNITNGRTLPRDFKLAAPYFAEFNGGISGVLNTNPLTPINYAAFGRVQLGGGNHPQQRMFVRIYYSKQ
jgi:Domain of unknown function (DUF4270)